MLFMASLNSKNTEFPREAPELAQFRGPHVAVDVALFTVAPGVERGLAQLAFLVVKRLDGLEKGSWALPGRMVREREQLSVAVAAALRDKCGLTGIEPKQLRVFDEPTRDSRGWVMSVAHLTVQHWEVVEEALSQNPNLALGYVLPGTHFRMELPDEQKDLPFEQDLIVQYAVQDLKLRYSTEPDPDRFLGSTFTIYQLRKAHEAVLGQELDKDVFRRKMEPKLQKTSEMSSGGVGKPAELFRRKS